MIRKIAIGLCVGLVGMLALASCTSPESQAAATATVIRANSLATSDALNNAALEQSNAARATSAAGQAYATATAVENSARATSTSVAVSVGGTSTAIALQAQATAAIQNQIIDATRTAVPYQAIDVETNSQTERARNWTATGGLIGLVAVAILMGLAFVSLVRTRGKLIPRGADGQLPGVLLGGVVIDPQRMLGATTVPQADYLYQVYRIAHYLGTGKVLPNPDQTPRLPDGVDADHLLAAVSSANAATGLAALARPGADPRDIKTRVEIIKQNGGLPQLAPPPTSTRVVFQGPVQAIAARLGDLLPDENPPTLIEGEAGFK